MDRAVMLMRVGAVLSLIGLIVTFTSKAAIRDAVEKASAARTTPMTPAQIDAAVGFATVVGIFTGLVGAALWLWMASANGKGRSWARIVATVFFGISVLGLLGSLVQAGSAIGKLVGMLGFLVGAAAIFFMYQKESTEFYKASGAPRV
jgi:hypothetical protein